MNVRIAVESDLAAVNCLRKQVNDLHVAGIPEVFKPGFCDELRDFLFVAYQNPDYEIVVAEENGVVLGFALLQFFHKPENPYKHAQSFLEIDELGVAEASHRQGVGRALIQFIGELARDRGFSRVELNMWEFNRNALAFYEALGFSTFRRYMELYV